MLLLVNTSRWSFFKISYYLCNISFILCSGISVRVVTRPGSQLLGINGRDDGPLVSSISFCRIGKI